ncbi:hypothetical protein MMC17_006236 [Xylographa soralifera]|nr:hypothetical protein [Xylographa soralifera]
MSHLQLEYLLAGVETEIDTYGVDDLRDGFFDASFYRPINRDHANMTRRASETLPLSLIPEEHLSLSQSCVQQILLLVKIFKTVATSRAGIKLSKSFLGVFICYTLSLIPAAKTWLGKYSYVAAISAIINHPGRSIGSQVDGAVLTTIGTLVGLSWGCLAQYVSAYDSLNSAGRPGVLAVFLFVFTALFGWLRCGYVRFYQANIAAGIAICYACLTNAPSISFKDRLTVYLIPWEVGQIITLTVCFLLFPAAGTRPLVISFHGSLQAIVNGLVVPRPISLPLNRELAWRFVDNSDAVRDFTIDLSFSPFLPDDARTLRNLIQSVIRATLAIRPESALFDLTDMSDSNLSESFRVKINFRPVFINGAGVSHSRQDPCLLVSRLMAGPTRHLIDAIVIAVRCVDAIIMDISGHRKYLGPPVTVSSDINGALERLKTAITSFDEAEEALLNHPDLPANSVDHPDLVDLFLFINPIRQAAERVQALSIKICEMRQRKQKWQMNMPSYPFLKSLQRSNAQLRHDRGGLTAGFYFHNKDQLEKIMLDLQSRTYVPTRKGTIDFLPTVEPLGSVQVPAGKEDERNNVIHPTKAEEKIAQLRYQLWMLLHRLQAFESRFMIKITFLVTLLSIPAWLPQSSGWWNDNESWWAVATVWIMMHPRVGGTMKDLAIRALSTIIGSVWGACANAAGRGSPYVLAIFAAIFMVPMLYRFTQSSHPRSGVIGCIAFIVVSLSEYQNGGQPSISYIGWTRGLAFVVGVVSAVVVNLVFWPFVTRHELRKSISSMLVYSAIIYRDIVARYMYHSAGDEPRPSEIAKSEMLEGRLREGFVRMRQLMELTSHEIRLRAPFDPVPYSALIEACERLFERLVDVRQSSVYFEPIILASQVESDSTLLAARRDAVAAILMNLYTLAGAIRSNHPVPRYLPSAAHSRRRLLDIMERAEAEKASKGKTVKPNKGRRWADVYRYAYSAALTDIVDQLQQLEYYAKEIVGEVGFDMPAGS